MKICEEVKIKKYNDGLDIEVYDEFTGEYSTIYLEDDTLADIFTKRFDYKELCDEIMELVSDWAVGTIDKDNVQELYDFKELLENYADKVHWSYMPGADLISDYLMEIIDDVEEEIKFKEV